MKFFGALAFGLLLAASSFSNPIASTAAAAVARSIPAPENVPKVTNSMCQCKKGSSAHTEVCPVLNPGLKGTRPSAPPKNEPMPTPTPKAKRDKNVVFKRAHDDHGWYPGDLVPDDDQQTQFVGMSRATFGRGGTFLWTRGLASCIGVAMYSAPPGNPHQGAKILAHVSGVNYQGQLTVIDTLAINNAHLLPNKVIYLIVPDLRYPAPDWNDAMVAALGQMINDVWNHFTTRYLGSDIRIHYHRIDWTGRVGEMVINYGNAIHIDGSQHCVN